MGGSRSSNDVIRNLHLSDLLSLLSSFSGNSDLHLISLALQWEESSFSLRVSAKPRAVFQGPSLVMSQP